MITHERLLEILHYDPETGIFTWKIALSRKSVPGTAAGTPHPKGYIYIQLEGKKYRAHRLAWLYMMGEWPPNLVDHEDNIASNNRWTNLRLADHAQNNRNARLKNSNKSGVKGVSRSRNNKKFQASIRINGKSTYLGSFDAPQEAASTIQRAREQFHGVFANHG